MTPSAYKGDPASFLMQDRLTSRGTPAPPELFCRGTGGDGGQGGQQNAPAPGSRGAVEPARPAAQAARRS